MHFYYKLDLNVGDLCEMLPFKKKKSVVHIVHYLKDKFNLCT